MTSTPESPQRSHDRPRRPSNRLPYFDPILNKLRQGDPDFIAASGLHVHWGYWPDPRVARRSVHDFAWAQEGMDMHLCDRAGINPGKVVLDAGCGFGGTIASLNQRLNGVTLHGLNIDERQLERAQRQVIARPGNSVLFVVGDACELPFADAAFDHVLAVECIMHFPSRLHFMREARRVLRPGGRLTISDFCPVMSVPRLLTWMLAFLDSSVKRTYGPSNITCTRTEYRKLALQAGFSTMTDEDITANTLPTYPVVRKLIRRAYGRETSWVTFALEWLSRTGLVRYMILSFGTPK